MKNFNVWPIVIGWGEGKAPSASDLQILCGWELSDIKRAKAWQIDSGSVATALEVRAQCLQALCNSLQTGAIALPLPGVWQDYVVLLWTFWLPFAQRLDAQQKSLAQPFIQGILGGQGTGKTTLSQVLTLILEQMGHRCAGLSLDDLYLTYGDRLKLQQSDPRLIWRGPPGTHDIALGLQTLDAVKTAEPDSEISLPQFDKSLHGGQGDRIPARPQVAPTILLFEGWFVGASPLADALFADLRIELPTPIDTPESRQFARDMNRQLYLYQPLWKKLDSLAVLFLEDYRLSYEWRTQAEQQMRAAGKTGLSDREIASFVTYFWQALHPQLFISPLVELSTKEPSYRKKADLAVKVGHGHTVKALYSP